MFNEQLHEEIPEILLKFLPVIKDSKREELKQGNLELKKEKVKKQLKLQDIYKGRSNN